MGLKVDGNCAYAEERWEHVFAHERIYFSYRLAGLFSDLIEMAQNTIIRFDF
jgi:hypothetical protein